MVQQMDEREPAVTLHRFHRLLAIGLCLFILPHLAGHLAGLAGQASFDRVQALMRPFYRNAVVEPLLLGAVLVQTGIGLRLAWLRWRRGLRGPLQRWQFVAGLVLAWFVISHLAALMAARWGFGLDSTFWWPASVASHWPLALYFWPYYFFGVLAFFVHLGIGATLALRRAGRTGAAKTMLWGVPAFGAVVSALILTGISGTLQPVDLPQEWQRFIAVLWLW